MAKFTVKNINAVSKSIRNKIEKKINKAQRASVNNMKELEKDIQAQMFSGKQPFDKRKKIPALKQSTIKARKGLARYNRTDSNYSAGKSNITFSGQLVRSFRSTVKVLKTKTRITLSFAGSRKQYRTKKGKAAKGVRSNSKLAGYLEDSGHLDLTLSKVVRSKIIANFKRIFKKLK